MFARKIEISEKQSNDNRGQNQCEDKRMRKSPMPPEIAIGDTKGKSKHIQIRDNRAE